MILASGTDRVPISVSRLNIRVRGEHTLTPFILLSEEGEKENETVKVDQYAVSVQPVWQRATVSPARPSRPRS